MGDIRVTVAPPLSHEASVEQYLRTQLPGELSLVELRQAPIRTDAGWTGTLHESQARKGDSPRVEMLAADFRVAGERALLYVALDSTLPDLGSARERALRLLRAGVPRFADSTVLSELLWIPPDPARAPIVTSTGQTFAGMRRSWTACGTAFELDGAARAGRVEVRFAVSPRVGIMDLARSAKEELKAAQGDARIVHLERGVTSGSEHFALVFVSGQATERGIGVVYGDRQMVLIDGEYALGAHRDRFREVVRRATLDMPLRGFPADRVRSVVHAVPDGWAVRTRDLTTHLVAPDGKSYITVLPAEPTAHASAMQKLVYEDVIAGATLATPMVSTRRVTPTGLTGEIVEVKGTSVDRARPFTLLTALLSDGRFRYTVRHEDAQPSRRDVFLAVVDSVQPVPRPSPVFSAGQPATQIYPID